MGWRYDYEPYVPVAKRRAQAAREMARRAKTTGQAASPVVIEGRTIVTTFWGKAWCTNLEGYSDFENRLPRGRTYARNGSVVDLKIARGRITAFVMGSELYTVQIDISALPRSAWQAVKKLCAGKIGSLVELLQGKLSSAVMEAVTNRAEGLFPKPKEIAMRCSCPDYAGMCKHLAAVMYGIGNRLDSSPELLFELRGVDHQELIEQAIPTAPVRTKPDAPTIETSALGAIFGIEIDEAPVAEPPAPKATSKKSPRVRPAPAATKVSSVKKATEKKAAAKKAATVKKAAPKKTATAKKSTPRKIATAKKSSAAKKKAAPVSRKG
jgi:uncharacterized Zn finger protein